MTTLANRYNQPKPEGMQRVYRRFEFRRTPSGTEGGPWTETTLYSMTGYPNGCSPINVALGTDTHDGQESDRTVCLGDGADGCDDWRGDRDDDERSRHFAEIVYRAVDCSGSAHLGARIDPREPRSPLAILDTS